MRKIHIFFGSSILNYKNEIDEINRFIMVCNESFEQKYKVSILSEVSASNFDEIISKCDICMFVFFDTVSSTSKKEIDIAYNLLKKSDNKKPKIYIYFKRPSVTQNVNDEISNFMAIVDKTYNHFYSSFSSIDTIKLKILLNVKLSSMSFLNLDFDGNDLVIDNYKYPIELDNIDEFKNNLDLQRLKKEYLDTNKKYLELRKNIDDKSVTVELKKEYIDICTKRKKIYDEIQQLNKKIFDVIYGISYNATYGFISDRMREAIQLVERGCFEDAIKVLSNSTIEQEYEKIEEEQKKASIIYVKEHYLAITILQTLINYKDRFKEIEERYSKIIKVVLNFGVEYQIIANYGLYLNGRNKTDEAIEYFKKYILIGDDKILVHSCNESLLNSYILKGDTEKIKEQSNQLINYLNELKKLSIINDDEYDYYLNDVKFHLASIFSNVTDRDSNIFAVNALIERYNYLTDKREKLRVLNYISDNYFRLKEFNQFSDTISLIAKELNSFNDDDIKNAKLTVANSYKSIALDYEMKNDADNARKYYEMALSLSKEIYEEDPVGSISHYLDGCLHLALLYSNNNVCLEKALELINYTIDNYAAVYKNNVLKEEQIIHSYFIKYNIGVKMKKLDIALNAVESLNAFLTPLYRTENGFDMDYYDEIKKIVFIYNQLSQYPKSLSIINYVIETISQKQIDKPLYIKYVEMSYYLIGTYYEMKNYDLCEKTCISLISDLSKVVEHDNSWASELINCCKKFGNILFQIKEYKKSELIFLKIIEYHNKYISSSGIYDSKLLLEVYGYLEQISNEIDKSKLELLWEQPCPCMSKKKYMFCHSKLYKHE